MPYIPSQWPAIPRYGDDRLGPVKFLAGSKVMLKGDVTWIFNDFNQRFHDTIERLDGGVTDDWGHNPRNIAGTNLYSRHARGIAEDLNAAQHPMFRDTMSAGTEAKIRALVKDYRGAIRWGGGDAFIAAGRIDQMHFEINVSPAELHRIVTDLKNERATGNVKPTAKPPVKPPKSPAKATWPNVFLSKDGDMGKVTIAALQQLLEGIDLYDGRIDGVFASMTKKSTQAWLATTGFYKGKIDGDFGPLSIDALQRFLKDRGFYPGRLDKDFGPVTISGLQGYINSQRRHYI